MILKGKSAITVLNKNGNSHLSPMVYYDKHRKVKEVEATWYDKHGNSKERYKKRDFIDISAVDGGTLYSDNRLLVVNFTPLEYPYTLEFEYEIESTNTAFIKPYYPIASYHSSIEYSEYKVNYPPELKFRNKTVDEQDLIAVKEQPGSLNYTVKNAQAVESEVLGPRFEDVAPHVLFALDEFYLEGVRGIGGSWEQFGAWMHNSLLNDVSELPQGTVKEIELITSSLGSNAEKARRVYQYVQDRTRYISVQIGIGGWKPMTASEVHNLGYGDCKALTNYTKSLLAVAGVPSYYTVVYAGNSKRNIDADFSSMQGNHVILAVPEQDDYIWLECTSQSIPFGFLGDFTDDRNVLLVTPEGGKIARTRKYLHSENTMITKGECTLGPDGNLEVEATIETGGIQYDRRYTVESKSTDDQQKYYKDYWDYVDNISITSIDIKNDREQIVLTENVKFSADAYTSFAGDDMILNVNVLNRATYIPKRYSDRKLPLVLSRGYLDKDEVYITLPEGYKLKSGASPITFETEFGSYSSSLTVQSDGRLKYERQLELIEGEFPKEKYDAYRKFRRKVSKSDKQKIILTK